MKKDGRKINRNYDNPIDNLLLDMAIPMNTFLYTLKFTPNMLTTISLLLSLLGSYSIFYKYYKIGALLLFIGYFFDCADGNFARKYNMVSKYGDYYDHISDSFKIIILYVIILCSNLKFNNKVIFIIVNIVFIILSIIHLGCQEKIYNKNNSKSSTLDITKYLCINKDNIKYTRYFGCGTFFVVMCLYVGLIDYIDKLL